MDGVTTLENSYSIPSTVTMYPSHDPDISLPAASSRKIKYMSIKTYT